MKTKDTDDHESALSELFGDEVAWVASQVAVPSLRVLQAGNVIRSKKIIKPHGGYRRAWSARDIMKASVAWAMNEYFFWSMREVSLAMSMAPDGIWDDLVKSCLVSSYKLGSFPALVRASDRDWHLELFEMTYLFLVIPSPAAGSTASFSKSTEVLLGAQKGGGYVAVPADFGSSRSRTQLETHLAPDDFGKLADVYLKAMTVRETFTGKITINLSARIRHAWRELGDAKPLGSLAQDTDAEVGDGYDADH